MSSNKMLTGKVDTVDEESLTPAKSMGGQRALTMSDHQA